LDPDVPLNPDPLDPDVPLNPDPLDPDVPLYTAPDDPLDPAIKTVPTYQTTLKRLMSQEQVSHHLLLVLYLILCNHHQ
jgi:hypothetical protein